MLQRKLSQEGTTFSELTDPMEQEIAENLLGDPDLTIADIGHKPLPTQRAFRQWSATKRMEYRKSRAWPERWWSLRLRFACGR